MTGSLGRREMTRWRHGTVSRMLATGASAPDFTLRNQDGDDVTLSSLRGRPVVVYFYPKTDTPG